MDPVTRAFESLSTLPALEGGFLRHLLFQAIDDPDVARNPALAEHLHLVPQVLRALALEPNVIRQIPTRPGMEDWARDALSAIAVVAASGHLRVSPDMLAKLSHIALRDPRFLANFLEGRPASPFL
jgi:hypothetical protein